MFGNLTTHTEFLTELQAILTPRSTYILLSGAFLSPLSKFRVHVPLVGLGMDLQAGVSK